MNWSLCIPWSSSNPFALRSCSTRRGGGGGGLTRRARCTRVSTHWKPPWCERWRRTPSPRSVRSGWRRSLSSCTADTPWRASTSWRISVCGSKCGRNSSTTSVSAAPKWRSGSFRSGSARLPWSGRNDTNRWPAIREPSCAWPFFLFSFSRVSRANDAYGSPGGETRGRKLSHGNGSSSNTDGNNDRQVLKSQQSVIRNRTTSRSSRCCFDGAIAVMDTPRVHNRGPRSERAGRVRRHICSARSRPAVLTPVCRCTRDQSRPEPVVFDFYFSSGGGGQQLTGEIGSVTRDVYWCTRAEQPGNVSVCSDSSNGNNRPLYRLATAQQNIHYSFITIRNEV